MADARDKLLVKLTDTCVALERRVARLEAALCGESRRNMALNVIVSREVERKTARPKRSEGK